jgi:NADH dehydrogenase [ubiquinone] 1 alpha subcomplex assembly factor 2
MEDPRARARAVPAPEMELKAKERRGSPLVEDEEEGVKTAEGTAEAARTSAEPAQTNKTAPSEKPRPKTKVMPDVKDPWARATAHGPGENWQPAAWDPSAAKKRR